MRLVFAIAALLITAGAAHAQDRTPCGVGLYCANSPDSVMRAMEKAPRFNLVTRHSKGGAVVISLLLASANGAAQNLSIFDPVSPQAESIRTFRILASQFSEERGTLTPSLKLKRRAIENAYAAEIEALYRG